MKYAALVFKNLFRSKRRTFLTVLSIAVSLFIFSALVSIPTVANEILGNTASSTRIATHNKAGLAYSIPVAYKQRIVSVPHVEVVVPESWFGGVYHEVYDQFPNLAADPDAGRQDVARLGNQRGAVRSVQENPHRGPGRRRYDEAVPSACRAANPAQRHALPIQRDAANSGHDQR